MQPAVEGKEFELMKTSRLKIGLVQPIIADSVGSSCSGFFAVE